PRCIPLPSVCRSLTLDLSFSTFFFTAPAPTQIYTLSLHDALPISVLEDDVEVQANSCVDRATIGETRIGRGTKLDDLVLVGHASDRKSTRLNSSHLGISYAVFCLKKKKNRTLQFRQTLDRRHGPDP